MKRVPLKKGKVLCIYTPNILANRTRADLKVGGNLKRESTLNMLREKLDEQDPKHPSKWEGHP